MLDYQEVTNAIPADQTTVFNEIIMRWDNVAIQWSDFACENSNQLGKRFRRRTGKRYSGFEGRVVRTGACLYDRYCLFSVQPDDDPDCCATLDVEPCVIAQVGY